MLRIKNMLCFVVGAILSSSPLMAQSTEEEGNYDIVIPKTSHLDEFINCGLHNNFQIRIVRNEEKIADNNATRANAGYLPKVNLTGGYRGNLKSNKTELRNNSGSDSKVTSFDNGLNAGIFAEWTVFDGFKIQTNYKRLKELRQNSATQTRIVIEDYVADLTAEYYNMIQQIIRMKNLRHAVALSKERLRIVQERYLIGSASRLDFQQAQVDFNADSAKSLKQYELLASSRIRLNEMMGLNNLNHEVNIKDSIIALEEKMNFDELWEATLRTNAKLIKSTQNKTLAELDYEAVKSRDFPYLKLNGGYNFQSTNFSKGSTRQRSSWGPEIGVTVGYKLFDGNRKRERNNAKIKIENAELAEQHLKITLKADIEDLWQAYLNNKRLLNLERQNLVNAQENHVIAHERYLLGDLSGIEMREAQQSLLDAEERILVAEFNTKLCEISLHQVSGSIMLYAE